MATATISTGDQPRIVRTGGIWTILRLLRESPKLVVGLILFGTLLAIALLEPAINSARLDGRLSSELGAFGKFEPLSAEHPLGTDRFGRDVLAMQFTGLRNSLLVGMVAGALSTVFAVAMASFAGYLGGRVEAVVTTITNSVLIIPVWPIMAIIMLFIAKPTLLFLAVILALFGWAGAARVITPQISSLKARPFVDMARVSGYGAFSIMFKEIVPNFLPYIVLGLTSSVANNILAETALRIVGLGPVTVPSLGLLINWELTSGSLAQGHYAVALSPIVGVTLIFVSLNLINLGLEEVYNPRLKKITGL